jgi:sterol 3beta-glucosyltransferase
MPGYFFLNDETWKPDRALEEFVAAGPPVVITFGSMTHNDADGLTDLALEAVENAGCRAVMQQGWSGLAQKRLPSSIHIADFIPHDWLFPRASCIVHHGGAGTAASVFRSGVPSVFVPHTFDHPLWAELARGLGCAGPTIPYLELTAKRLGDAIVATLTNDGICRAAAELGEKVRAEQGLRRSRQLVEALVNNMGFRSPKKSQTTIHNESHRLETKQARRRIYLEKQRSRRKEVRA